MSNDEDEVMDDDEYRVALWSSPVEGGAAAELARGVGGGAALHPKTMGQTNNETCNSDLSANNNTWQPQPPFCHHFQHNTNGDDITGDQTAWRNQTPALRAHPQHGTAPCKCKHGAITKSRHQKPRQCRAHNNRVTPPLPDAASVSAASITKTKPTSASAAVTT